MNKNFPSGIHVKLGQGKEGLYFSSVITLHLAGMMSNIVGLRNNGIK
jgi:hypothetical protein